jgi:hypothetical protein
MNKNIFVITGGKTGGSTIKNTFCLNKNFNAIHLHDNSFFQNTTIHTSMISIFDLIDHDRCKNMKSIIISSYRTKIERKISSFFQNISTHLPDYKNLHVIDLINIFNSNYLNLLECTEPFNEILKNYNYSDDLHFDFDKKYLEISMENIKMYIVRFEDINIWNNIFSDIFNENIIIYDDNKTENKEIYKIYQEFIREYKIPIKMLEELICEKEFKIFNTQKEQMNYYDKWIKKSF